MKHAISGCLSLALVGCASGSGEVAVTVWGEAFIEEEIPAAEVVDGWRLQYDRFLIVIGEVEVGGGPEAVRRLGVPTLFDLHAAGPHSVGLLTDLEEGPWTDVGYAVAPATAATVVHPSATQADLQHMLAGGFSLYVEGSAEKGGATKTFAWGFATETHYSRCVDTGGAQQIDGIVIGDGATAAAELTIHGDHLFYDDLQSPAAELRFDHLAAADADGDGAITLEELSAVPLASLPVGEGSYGVGASDVDDLGAYVTAATRTLGHFNGEGHCEIARRD